MPIPGSGHRVRSRNNLLTETEPRRRRLRWCRRLSFTMTKDKTVAFVPIDNEQLNSPPSQLFIAENMAIYRNEIVLALRKFTSREIAKLALATDLTVSDLLGPKGRLRDTLWIEFRYAIVEEPIALRLAFQGVAADPESHDNRALVRKLKCLDPELAHLLAWVVVAVTKSELLDKAIQGAISDNFCLTEIESAISPVDQKPGPRETVSFEHPVSEGANNNSQEFVGSLVGGSSRTHR